MLPLPVASLALDPGAVFGAGPGDPLGRELDALLATGPGVLLPCDPGLPATIAAALGLCVFAFCWLLDVGVSLAAALLDVLVLELGWLLDADALLLVAPLLDAVALEPCALLTPPLEAFAFAPGVLLATAPFAVLALGPGVLFDPFAPG